MRRHEEVRYAADDLAVNLLRVVVDEPDGVAYQVARLFYLSDVEGSAELAFAVENIDGSPYDADSLSFDKTELADVLGDFYVDADLGNFEGKPSHGSDGQYGEA